MVRYLLREAGQPSIWYHTTSQSGPEAESAASTSSSSAGTSTSNSQSLGISPAPAKKNKVASKSQEDWKRYNMKQSTKGASYVHCNVCMADFSVASIDNV